MKKIPEEVEEDDRLGILEDGRNFLRQEHEGRQDQNDKQIRLLYKVVAVELVLLLLIFVAQDEVAPCRENSKRNILPRLFCLFLRRWLLLRNEVFLRSVEVFLVLLMLSERDFFLRFFQDEIVVDGENHLWK